MRLQRKELILLHGEIQTPPISVDARKEIGALIRRLQRGEMLAMPHSRPMAGIGPRCHELRVVDENQTWRVIYRIDPDEILVAEVFSKKTQQTPQPIIDACKDRFRRYDGE